MARGYKRGWDVHYDWDNKKWVYSDNKEEMSIERSCKKCGLLPTPEGYDACIGYILGKKSVCCGHGVTEPINI